MMILMLVTLGLVYSVQSQTSDCVPSEDDRDALTQFIFTYGKLLRLTDAEKTAIGFTVFNRVEDPNFPNSTADVVNWEVTKRGKVRRFYRLMAKPKLLSFWNQAKDGNTGDFQDVQQLSSDILCGDEYDPTEGATDFSRREAPRFFKAPRFLGSLASHIQIGKLYFFKLTPKTSRG